MDGTACHLDCFQLVRKHERNKCAVWHQLTALNVQPDPPSCEAFILGPKDICTVVGPGLRVICNADMDSISIEPSLTVLRDLNNTCWAVWDGKLAPQLGALVGVAGIDLTYNNMPTSYVTGCARLMWRGYQVRGPLPAEWATIQFVGLDSGIALQYNLLDGTLPPEWGALKGLGWLDLRRNFLSGTIPGSWSRVLNIGKLAGNKALSGPPPQVVDRPGQWDFSGTGVDVWALRSQAGQLCRGTVDYSQAVVAYNDKDFLYFGHDDLYDIADYQPGRFDRIWYCGRRSLLTDVLVVWLFICICVTATKAAKILCKGRPRGDVAGDSDNGEPSLVACRLGRTGRVCRLAPTTTSVLQLAIMIFLDLSAQIILVVTMTGSWLFIGIGTSIALPGWICTNAVLWQGAGRIPSSPLLIFFWLSWPVTMSVTTVLFTILVLMHIVWYLSGGKKPREGLAAVLFGLNTTSLLSMYSVVMVFSGSILVLVVATIILLFITFAPGEFFFVPGIVPVWSFWLAGVAVCLHLCFEVWRSEKGRAVFRGLYIEAMQGPSQWVAVREEQEEHPVLEEDPHIDERLGAIWLIESWG